MPTLHQLLDHGNLKNKDKQRVETKDQSILKSNLTFRQKPGHEDDSEKQFNFFLNEPTNDYFKEIIQALESTPDVTSLKLIMHEDEKTSKERLTMFVKILKEHNFKEFGVSYHGENEKKKSEIFEVVGQLYDICVIKGIKIQFPLNETDREKQKQFVQKFMKQKITDDVPSLLHLSMGTLWSNPKQLDLNKLPEELRDRFSQSESKNNNNDNNDNNPSSGCVLQ